MQNYKIVWWHLLLVQIPKILSDRRKDIGWNITHFLGNFYIQDSHKIDFNVNYDKESNDWLQLLNVWLTPEFDLILMWSTNVDAKLFILDTHTWENENRILEIPQNRVDNNRNTISVLYDKTNCRKYSIWHKCIIMSSFNSKNFIWNFVSYMDQGGSTRVFHVFVWILFWIKSCWIEISDWRLLKSKFEIKS